VHELQGKTGTGIAITVNHLVASPTGRVDMRKNLTKQLLLEGRVAAGIFLTSSSPLVAEILAHAGFDWVLVDLQHSENSLHSLQGMLQAICTTNATPLVRVAANDPMLIQRAVDIGAYGVMVPLVNTRAEAEAAVAATRYPPKGIRSWGTPRGLLYGGPDYFQGYAEEMLVIALLETQEAAANAGEVLSVPGIDACMIGPNDLSVSMGYGPEQSEIPAPVEEAIQEILAASIACGKAPGIQTYSVESANQRLHQGFRFVGLGSDVRLVSQASRATLGGLIRPS
jgi:4-hydroxy-2-oxoheptanedioate aldolase